jgi:hypothetical protein
MPSTLNFGVFSDGLPEKKLQLVCMSILIDPIKPWAGMSQKPSVKGRFSKGSSFYVMFKWITSDFFLKKAGSTPAGKHTTST